MSGSKGLQRYVPRILQDSGMIASSEVAHYTHLKLVQYVKADDIDAALRRAKAEGIRMVETYARACVHERAVQLDGFTGSSGMAGVIRGKQAEADRIVDWAYACAAQIEEGE